MKPNSQLTNVEGWIWKKDRLKKNISQPGLTC
jgi:hypothetical protein